jgi:hypothetical protein
MFLSLILMILQDLFNLWKVDVDVNVKIEIKKL